jgi:hypothetical protein
MYLNNQRFEAFGTDTIKIDTPMLRLAGYNLYYFGSKKQITLRTNFVKSNSCCNK